MEAAMFDRHYSFAVISTCWIYHYLITLTAISHSKAVTWFEAQTNCSEKNQSLTLLKNKSGSFYWTGLYKERSHWIKIIGCFTTSGVQNGTKRKIELSTSSPSLCQNHCFQENSYTFAVQNRTCVCLSDGFDNSQNQLAPSNCTFTCEGSGLLSKECGGESAFNVFSTDTTNLNVNSRCLSLQCGNDPKFLDNTCNTALPMICSSLEVDDTTDNNWKKKKESCKVKGTYPLGNLTLSNVTMACTESNHNTTSPRWIGVFHETKETEDQGQLIPISNQVFVKRCMKCRIGDPTQIPNCKYESCNKNLTATVYCSEEEFTTPQPENTDTSYSESTSISSTLLYETASIVSISNDSDKTGSKGSAIIIVPVIIVLLLLSGFAIAIVLYVRRKKQLEEKDTVGGKSSPAIGSANYLNVENHTDNNYFVLQQNNPSYELAGHCIVGSESPYNDAEEGTYDHLGNKNARKTPAEDIYNHTSGLELPDLSDYDVANHKHLNEDDSTYDHAGVVDNSYGHFNLHQIKETDYSEFS